MSVVRLRLSAPRFPFQSAIWKFLKTKIYKKCCLLLLIVFLICDVQALEGRYYRASSGKLGSDFTLSEPQDLLNTTRDHVVVRGVNHLKRYVFVNGERVPLRADGSFYAKIKLPEAGKETIVVIFKS